MDNAQVPKQPKSPLKIMENESEPENRHMYLDDSIDLFQPTLQPTLQHERWFSEGFASFQMPFEEISPQVYSGWSGPAPVWSLPTFIPQREYKPSVGTAEEPSWRDKNVFNETPRLSLQRSHSPRFRVRPQQPYNGPNSGGTGNRRWVRRVDSRYVDLKQRNPTHERGRSVNPFDSAQVTPESLAERIMLCLSPPQSASFFVDVGASAFISQAYINNIEAPPAKESSVDKSHTYASTRFPNAQRDWRTLYENGNKSATAFANGFNDYTPPSANPNAATLCEDCHQGHETLPDTPSKMTEESGAELVRALMKFYRSHYKCLLCGDQASSDGSEFMDHVRNHMDAPGSVYQRTYDKNHNDMGGHVDKVEQDDKSAKYCHGCRA